MAGLDSSLNIRGLAAILLAAAPSIQDRLQSTSKMIEASAPEVVHRHSPSATSVGGAEDDAVGARKARKAVDIKNLNRLLEEEERQTMQLRNVVKTTADRLTNETIRSEGIERQLRELQHREAQLRKAKRVADKEAADAATEAQIYRLQLNLANRENAKAQDHVNNIDNQRVDAEEAAARARSTARKLQEKLLIQRALERGRSEGLEEGLRQGYDEGVTEGWLEGRENGYDDMKARALRMFERALQDGTISPNAEFDLDAAISREKARLSTLPPSLRHSASVGRRGLYRSSNGREPRNRRASIDIHTPPQLSSPPEHRRRRASEVRAPTPSITPKPPPPDLPPAPMPSTMPEPIIITPMPSLTVPSPPPNFPTPISFPNPKPESTRTRSPSPSRRPIPSAPPTPRLHPPIEMLPDGFVPTLNDDGNITLPPPHEMNPTPGALAMNIPLPSTRGPSKAASGYAPSIRSPRRPTVEELLEEARLKLEAEQQARLDAEATLIREREREQREREEREAETERRRVEALELEAKREAERILAEAEREAQRIEAERLRQQVLADQERQAQIQRDLEEQRRAIEVEKLQQEKKELEEKLAREKLDRELEVAAEKRLKEEAEARIALELIKKEQIEALKAHAPIVRDFAPGSDGPRDASGDDDEDEDEEEEDETDEITTDEGVRIPYPSGGFPPKPAPTKPRRRNDRASVYSAKTGMSHRTAGAASTPLSSFSVLDAPNDDRQRETAQRADHANRLIREEHEAKVRRGDPLTPNLSSRNRSKYPPTLGVIHEQPSVSDLHSPAPESANFGFGNTPNGNSYGGPSQTPRSANPILPIYLDRGPPNSTPIVHVMPVLPNESPTTSHASRRLPDNGFYRGEPSTDNNFQSMGDRNDQGRNDYRGYGKPRIHTTTPAPLSDKSFEFQNNRPSSRAQSNHYQAAPPPVSPRSDLPPLPGFGGSHHGSQGGPSQSLWPGQGGPAFGTAPGSPATSQRDGAKPVSIPTIRVQRPSRESSQTSLVTRTEKHLLTPDAALTIQELPEPDSDPRPIIKPILKSSRSNEPEPPVIPDIHSPQPRSWQNTSSAGIRPESRNAAGTPSSARKFASASPYYKAAKTLRSGSSASHSRSPVVNAVIPNGFPSYLDATPKSSNTSVIEPVTEDMIPEGNAPFRMSRPSTYRPPPYQDNSRAHGSPLRTLPRMNDWTKPGSDIAPDDGPKLVESAQAFGADPPPAPIFPSKDPIFSSNVPLFPPNEPIFPSNEPIFPSNEPIFLSNEPPFPSTGLTFPTIIPPAPKAPTQDSDDDPKPTTTPFTLPGAVPVTPGARLARPLESRHVDAVNTPPAPVPEIPFEPRTPGGRMLRPGMTYRPPSPVLPSGPDPTVPFHPMTPGRSMRPQVAGQMDNNPWPEPPAPFHPTTPGGLRRPAPKPDVSDGFGAGAGGYPVASGSGMRRPATKANGNTESPVIPFQSTTPGRFRRPAPKNDVDLSTDNAVPFQPRTPGGMRRPLNSAATQDAPMPATTAGKMQRRNPPNTPNMTAGNINPWGSAPNVYPNPTMTGRSLQAGPLPADSGYTPSYPNPQHTGRGFRNVQIPSSPDSPIFPARSTFSDGVNPVVLPSPGPEKKPISSMLRQQPRTDQASPSPAIPTIILTPAPPNAPGIFPVSPLAKPSDTLPGVSPQPDSRWPDNQKGPPPLTWGGAAPPSPVGSVMSVASHKSYRTGVSVARKASVTTIPDEGSDEGGWGMFD